MSSVPAIYVFNVCAVYLSPLEEILLYVFNVCVVYLSPIEEIYANNN